MAKSLTLVLSKPTIFMMLHIITCLSCIVVHADSKQDQASTWYNIVPHGHELKTTLKFYLHDIVSGNSPTAIRLITPSQPNGSGFGIVNMADDPLTVGPSPKSKLVGRAQGLYGSASQEELSLVLALSYTFREGIYNGSSLNILGRNWATHPVREIAVVGGSGVFRMARGYAILHTYWYNENTGDAIVGYNVTVYTPKSEL